MMQPKVFPRVVVDTNVLVSATIMPHGNPNRLFALWAQRAFSLLISDELLREVERVLHKAAIRRKYHLSDERINTLIRDLQGGAERIVPQKPLPISSRDPHDDMFLAVALDGHADYLVTGDDDLLTLNGAAVLGNLRILTVSAFLALVAAHEEGE